LLIDRGSRRQQLLATASSATAARCRWRAGDDRLQVAKLPVAAVQELQLVQEFVPRCC
jgi:hypothetical protein